MCLQAVCQLVLLLTDASILIQLTSLPPSWALTYPAQQTPLQLQVLGFVDLGGHEKYLKTALYGMTCMLPDYVLLCHSAVLPSLSKVFREHLAAALALRIPTAIVLTKVCASAVTFLLVIPCN